MLDESYTALKIRKISIIWKKLLITDVQWYKNERMNYLRYFVWSYESGSIQNVCFYMRI